MTDRLRSGIIGAGFAGAAHARAVRAAGGVVTAVVCSTGAASAAAAQRLLAERPAASALELAAADDVDIVHVCSPNHTHASLVTRALAAGKHVICEKPLATDLAGAQQMAMLAATAGVVAAVPFVYRFYPTVRAARSRVRRGDTGPLRLLHGTYLQDWLASPEDYDWRVDPALGGASRAFADIGVHWCDLIEFVTGHRITRVCGRMLIAYPQRRRNGRLASAATEDAAAVLFETDEGALGSLVISQISPGRKNRLWFSLDGADGSLSFDQQEPESLWLGTRQGSQLIPRGADDLAGPYNILPPGHPQGYQDCFTAFISDVYAAIGGQPPAGLPTFADGLRAAALTEAVLKSAQSHAWVEVPS